MLLYIQLGFLGVAMWLTMLHGFNWKSTFFFRLPGWKGLGASFLCFLGVTGIILLLRPILYDIPFLKPDPKNLKIMEEQVQNVMEHGPIISFFLFVITPAICEEMFFRGFLLRSFTTSISPLLAFFISGLLFGVGHVLPTRIILMALMGFFLAFLVWKARSILLAVLVHFLHNAFVFSVELMNTNSERPFYFTLDFSFDELLSTVGPLGLIGLIILGGTFLVSGLFLAEQAGRNADLLGQAGKSAELPPHVPYRGL